MRQDLDRVSATRPVGMIHASAHILNCNNAALSAVGCLCIGIDFAGVPLGDDALPSGELKGPGAMQRVAQVLGMDRAVLADLCVLDEDPLAVPSMALKGLPVWGVVQHGHAFAAAERPTGRPVLWQLAGRVAQSAPQRACSSA